MALASVILLTTNCKDFSLELSLYLPSLSFSVIVARIKFSQPQYTVREGPQICVDVVNELYDSTSPTGTIIITANIGKQACSCIN